MGPSSSKFRPAKAREVIAGVLSSRLAGTSHNPDKMSVISKEIADEIKQNLRDAGWQRYKYAVQVFIGEQRGEGCRMASRCFWDNETDAYAFESFKNESIFCVAAVFAAYVY